MKKSKLALFQSVVSLLLCISMLMGTTFAWFTDSVTSANNIIKTGNLKIGMDWADGTQDPDAADWKDASQGAIFNYELWEPGYTEVRHIRIENKGSLALKYQLKIIANGEVSNLADVIDVYYTQPAEQIVQRTQLTESMKLGTLTEVLGRLDSTANGHLEATESVTLTLALKMQESAGNEYQNLSIGSNFSVVLLATQYTSEDDSFDEFYDKDADFDFPANSFSESVTEDVAVADGKVTQDTTIQGATTSADIPAGVQVNDGINALTVSVSDLDSSSANVTPGENEAMRPLNVHVEGVAPDNDVPMTIKVKEVAPKGLNAGNLKLYHVENGQTVEMTLAGATPTHNQFQYDPATGDITLYMATFSEVALVADTENAWNGTVATAFGGGSGTETDPYIIANADQLAYLNEVISNENENYGDKHYKLIADINLGGEKNAEAGKLFYPIGYHKVGGTVAALGVDDAPEFIYQEEDPDYARSAANAVATGDATTWYTYGGSFRGTFDGAGHTIANIYQNTWQLKGNYDGNYWNAAMGLFGYVNGGTVKNLTVDNFSSDGEFTPTGVIAAYAANSTFENIAITNCNPRVYNTGNGGIVGIGGNSSDTADAKLTFTNITIDNTNKISALWGSWDVACGGLVGMFRGAGHVYMTNCHVAAQIDVYNDVCGNYQYYWYRYAGMMVGTNKNMTTDANGYTVPETDKFHAENCTVHFGEWNDYYYCELVANSLASYTHDHQFSRLEQVKAVDGTQITQMDSKIITVPATGRYNYVVVNGNAATENATCYHFVNGEVWTHDKAGTETVNGVEGVLKEDKQHVYLPFNQLFTGYGWGVKHVPIYDDGTGFDGITILKREVADSVKKFEGKVTELANEKEYKLSDIFGFVNGEVELVPEALVVTVTNKEESNPVSYEFVRDPSAWENGTLTLSGTGNVKITIQDYYFCTPTTIEVTVTERQDEQKFTSKFTGNFLYRVGNKNTVALDSLFTGENVSGDVSVTIETVEGNAAGEYTTNSTWSQGTIQFSGTGVVKVTITDNDYCIPTELNLEVVDAVNVTSASDWKDDTNSVLLNKIDLNTVKRITGNKTFYGNGFTINATGAPYSGVDYDYASYVIYLENSSLDNVIIEGLVYPSVGGTRTDNYYRALVMTNGNCKITNCFLSNTASPIRNGGNLELKDSILKGGAYANMDIRNGHTILDNVTTINQFGEGIVNGAKEVIGLGIVVYQEGGTEDLKITIRNKLTQYNLISKKQAESLEGYAKTFVDKVFSESAFSNYRYNDGSTEWVNTGIISMNNYFSAVDLSDERYDEHNYFGTEATVSLATQSRNCYVYSYKPSSDNSSSNVSPEAGVQGIIPPNAVFDFANKNYVAKSEGSNDYCIEDSGKVLISMDEGDTFNWDTSILTVTKNGQPIPYTVTMGGVDYTNKSITFNQTGTFTVTYVYTDDSNYQIDSNGNITTYEQSYTKELTIDVAVVKAAAKHAVFSFGANGTAYNAKTVTIGDKTYVMPDVTATVDDKIGSTTVNGVTVYYPITEMYTSDGKTAHTGSWYACFPIFKDAVQIIDFADQGTGDSVTYNQTTVTTVAQIPSTLNATNPTSAFLYSMNATNYPPPATPSAVSSAVCYTCNKNGLTASNTRNEMTIFAEYTYTDNAGSVYYYYIGYHCEQQTNRSTIGCFAEGTLITLADGTQKPIEQVTYADELLAWDFNTGAYAVTVPSLIESHDAGEYRVINLKFADGTVARVIVDHGFFDVEENNFVYIDEENVASYVGHDFVRVSEGGSYESVELIGYDVTVERVCYYTIQTAIYNNCIAENMFTLTSPPEMLENDGWFDYFEIGDGMKYDEAKKQADIEKYGLYTYEDFADYVTFEQFIAFNGPYLKVLVGRGVVTYEQILDLIATYVNN